MARCHVVAWSHVANQNVLGRAHANPILDTRKYKISFSRGGLTELMINVIDKSMCTQCDADGNQYLLLDVLLDYHKDNKAISLTDQQTSIWGRPVTLRSTAHWKKIAAS